MRPQEVGVCSPTSEGRGCERPDLGLEEVGVVARGPDLKRLRVLWSGCVVLYPTRSDLAVPNQAEPDQVGVRQVQ